MKCFLLELCVIYQESNNMDMKDTVYNLILLANSSLSSNGVSYPTVVQCYIGSFWFDWRSHELDIVDKQTLRRERE